MDDLVFMDDLQYKENLQYTKDLYFIDEDNNMKWIPDGNYKVGNNYNEAWVNERQDVLWVEKLKRGWLIRLETAHEGNQNLHTASTKVKAMNWASLYRKGRIPMTMSI